MFSVFSTARDRICGNEDGNNSLTQLVMLSSKDCRIVIQTLGPMTKIRNCTPTVCWLIKFYEKTFILPYVTT